MVLGVVIGLAAGLAIGLAWHLARLARTAGSARLAEGRLTDAQAQSAALAAQLKTASEAAAAAETARAVAVSELDLLRTSEIEAARRAGHERDLLAGAFSELSAQALAKNNEQFLTLADSKLNEVRTATQGDLSQRQQAIAQLLDPLSETLARYERGLRDMEVERKGAYATLNERVAALHLGHEQLQKETRNLVTALRSPQTRGRWGEMTLRNAVKAAGMAEHCDFDEQRSTSTADGLLRPDMIVHLPGGGQVVIDSKVPLDAFLHFTESEDEDERRPSSRSTPVSSVPTWTSWPRRSTGGSSSVRPSSSWPSFPANRCWRPPARRTPGCRTMHWARASCSPPPTPWWRR